MQTIERRLSVLERSARMWRTACLGLVVAGASGVGIAAAPAKKPAKAQELVRARQIEVVNEAGEVRVMIEGSDEGGGILIFGEGNALIGAQIAADRKGGMVRTYDKAGRLIWAAGNK